MIQFRFCLFLFPFLRIKVSVWDNLCIICHMTYYACGCYVFLNDYFFFVDVVCFGHAVCSGYAGRCGYVLCEKCVEFGMASSLFFFFLIQTYFQQLLGEASYILSRRKSRKLPYRERLHPNRTAYGNQSIYRSKYRNIFYHTGILCGTIF